MWTFVAREHRSLRRTIHLKRISCNATLFTPLTDNRLAMFLGSLVRRAAPFDGERTNQPLFSAYPQLMKRAQTRQDAASQPSAVSSFDGVSGRVYFHLYIFSSLHDSCPGYTHVREVTRELCFKSICKTSKQAPSAGEHDVSHEDLTQVWVASTQRFREQGWDVFGQVWILGLCPCFSMSSEIRSLKQDLPRAVESGRRTLLLLESVLRQSAYYIPLETRIDAASEKQRL